jgi:hypothetical protein
MNLIMLTLNPVMRLGAVIATRMDGCIEPGGILI